MGIIKKLKRRKIMSDFKKDFYSKQEALRDGRFKCEEEDLYPILNEAVPNTPFDAHYIYHPAWAAHMLAATKPERHVDISSSLSFVTMASAIVPVDFYDFRPPKIALDNFSAGFADVCALPFADNSLASLSCMHVMEHIGLGRYGDPFDPQGDLKGMAELQRVLAPGGRLLFVVPICGTPRIHFNAHRYYSYDLVLSSFEGLTLEKFALVTDEPSFIMEATKALSDAQDKGCGCFSFLKPEV